MRLTRYLGKTDAGSICRASQALMYPTETGEIRRCVLRQFPYTLRYAVRGDLIVVVAVLHHHRSPDFWVDRISS